MKKHKPSVSKMQKEVWKMKDRVLKKTKNVNAHEYFRFVRAEGGKFEGPSKSRTARSK